MVRLVFRPYAQLRRSICTSESLRSSIRVSPDFNLARHSSPSFGSQHLCSAYSQQCEVDWKSRDCALRIVPRAWDKLGQTGDRTSSVRISRLPHSVMHSMVRDNLERFQSVVFHSCRAMVRDNLERTAGRLETVGTCTSEDARLVQEEETVVLDVIPPTNGSRNS